MRKTIDEIWTVARGLATTNTLAENEFHLLKIDPAIKFEIFAGTDSSGNVMLVIGVDSRPPAIEVDTPALDYFRHQRADGTWLMALRLLARDLQQVFGKLCQDLVDAATAVTTQTALISLFRGRLLLWKRLFQDGGKGLLQNHEVKGLIAELIAFKTLLLQFPKERQETTVAWAGPLKGDQDFIFSNLAVEVKGISPFSDRIGIASEAQLSSAVPIEIWVYRLKESAATEIDSITLPRAISAIEVLLIPIPSALAMFRDKLLKTGFVDHDHYQTIAFTVVTKQTFLVAEEFPRMEAKDLMAGICDLSYSVLLTAMQPFLKTSTQ